MATDKTFPRVSRRNWLKALLAGLGAGLALNRRAPAARAAGEDAVPETGPLTVHVARPLDAETPVREFASFLTPTHRVFVRSHFGPPPSHIVAEPKWTLQVGGTVERAQAFSLSALRRFAPATITAVLQCSGNGRAHHRPKVPGVQWDRGAVGNVEWTGVRLRDVLNAAGVRPESRHVQFQGADRPVAAAVPLFIRSIPLDKALHPDTILAYAMNGRPLPLLHGAPLRVITPGWMAESCIKWLTDVTVREDEAKGYYMQTAYRTPSPPVEPGESVQGRAMRPVEAMIVKSLIAGPAEGDRVGLAPVTIHGVAWSGEATVTHVDVSTDGGATWRAARLVGPDLPYAWRQWQITWQPDAAGPVTILCRATDATGAVQPERSPWNPSGFLWNGWDRVTVTVQA